MRAEHEPGFEDDMSVNGRCLTLSSILQDKVYRIGLESLQNAHASHIAVEFIYDKPSLRVRIRDGKRIDRNMLQEGAKAVPASKACARPQAQRRFGLFRKRTYVV
jgi:hypothetical protein